MPEGASEGADAATHSDQCLMVNHVRGVRSVRTEVKGVEYVRPICDYTYMTKDRSVGEKLLAMKLRADLTLEEIAERARYRGKSSIQEYFKAEYEGPLGSKAAAKLASAFDGLGSPPIMGADILALAGASPPANGTKITRYEGASSELMKPDLPIYGTALGAEIIVEGEAIEQTTLNRAEIVGYAKRPVILNGNPDVYGLHVQGSSMDPVHPDGSFIVAQKDRPLRIGDDVVVYLRPKDDTDDGVTATQVLVKRLVRRSAQYIELRQFTPDTIFRIAACDVLRTDRVLTLGDLLS